MRNLRKLNFGSPPAVEKFASKCEYSSVTSLHSKSNFDDFISSKRTEFPFSKDFEQEEYRMTLHTDSKVKEVKGSISSLRFKRSYTSNIINKKFLIFLFCTKRQQIKTIHDQSPDFQQLLRVSDIRISQKDEQMNHDNHHGSFNSIFNLYLFSLELALTFPGLELSIMYK